MEGMNALSLTGTAGSFNAGKLISPMVSIKKGGSVVNHFPVMTEFNAGTADALDGCSQKSVDTAYLGCTAFVMAEPADTVGSAKGVLEGEGSGNQPSVNTCEMDVTREAACHPLDFNATCEAGCMVDPADFVGDVDMTTIESTSVDTQMSEKQTFKSEKEVCCDKESVFKSVAVKCSADRSNEGNCVVITDTIDDECVVVCESPSSMSKFTTHAVNADEDVPGEDSVFTDGTKFTFARVKTEVESLESDVEEVVEHSKDSGTEVSGSDASVCAVHSMSGSQSHPMVGETEAKVRMTFAGVKVLQVVGATYLDPECGPTKVEAVSHDDHAMSGGEVGRKVVGKSWTEGKDHAAEDGDATYPCPNAQGAIR